MMCKIVNNIHDLILRTKSNKFFTKGKKNRKSLKTEKTEHSFSLKTSENLFHFRVLATHSVVILSRLEIHCIDHFFSFWNRGVMTWHCINYTHLTS